jgi:hypothetical protein
MFTDFIDSGLFFYFPVHHSHQGCSLPAKTASPWTDQIPVFANHSHMPKLSKNLCHIPSFWAKLFLRGSGWVACSITPTPSL